MILSQVLAVLLLNLAYTGGRSYRSHGRVDFRDNPFRCPSAGYHADPVDCATFYRCVDWSSNSFFRDESPGMNLAAFRFTCSDGTVFDPTLNTCNYPVDTSRVECRKSPQENELPFNYPSSGGPPEGEAGDAGEPCTATGFAAVKGDCRKFVRCEEDGTGGYRKFVFSCGEGTAWDQRNSVCNHANLVPGCGQSGGYPTTEGSYEYPGAGEGSPYPGGEYPGGVNHGGYPGPEGGYPGGYPGSPVGYPGESSQGGYYPGEYPETGNQVYPGSGGGYPGYPGSPVPDQGGYYPSPGDSIPVDQGYYPSQSEYPGQGGTQNRPDASGYYPNQGGYPGPTFQESTPGYQEGPGYPGYYPEQGNPVPGGYPGYGAYNPNQGGSPGPNGMENLPGQGNYPESGYYPSYPQEPGNPVSGESSGYPDECQGDGFFAVRGSCTDFFRCVDNGEGGYFRYNFTCGKGTVWDQSSSTCNHPWAVQRDDVDCSQTVATTESSQDASRSTSMQETTATDSQSWSQTTSSFTSSSSSSYYNSSSTQSQQSTSTTQSQSSMMSSTHSQQSTSQMMGTSQSQSTTPMKPQTTAKPTTTPVSKPEEEITTGPKDPSDPPPGSMPCQPEKNSPIKCEKEGFYPNPENCRKFYRCADWDGDKGQRFSVYHFECSEGTIWDPALETCNHEESVYPPRNCKGGANGEDNQPKQPITTTEPEEETMSTSTETDGSSTAPPESTTTTESPVQTSTDQSEPTTSTSEMSQSTTTEASEETNQPSTSTEQTSQPTSTDAMEPTSTEMTEQTSQPTTTDESEETSQPTTTDGMEQTTQPMPEETTDASQTSTESPDETEELSTTSSPTDSTESSTPSQEATTMTQTPQQTSPDCPALEEGQVAFVCPTGFRRHPNNCNLFYQCTISKDGDVNVMTLSCKNQTVYDERKIQCLPEDETDPCPNKQRPRTRFNRKIEPETTSVVPVWSSHSLCPSEGRFPYDGDCQRFFKCRRDRTGRMQGYLYQCPEKYSFSDGSRKCERSSKLSRCFRSFANLSPVSLKWMATKIPTEYLNVDER